MKKIIITLFSIVSLSLASCGDESTTENDSCKIPGDAFKTTLRIQGQGNYQLNFDTGLTTNGTDCYEVDLSYNSSNAFEPGFCPNDQNHVSALGSFGIVDMGGKCLGAIDSNDIPAQFKASATSSEEHSYVIKTQNGDFWAFYVIDYVTSAEIQHQGGVIGADIAYKQIF